MIVLLLVTLLTDPYIRFLKGDQTFVFTFHYPRSPFVNQINHRFIQPLKKEHIQSNSVALESSCQSMVYRSVGLYMNSMGLYMNSMGLYMNSVGLYMNSVGLYMNFSVHLKFMHRQTSSS